MKYRAWGCWVALLTAGCGGGGGAGGAGTSAEPNFRDGTRLVARTFSTPGAAVLLVGIYDRQEQVECEFGVAPDGKVRCLPADSVGPSKPATAELSERWQEGTEIAVAPTGRVFRNQIHSADGGQFPNWVSGEFRDARFGQPCRPDTTREIDGTGVGLCLPNFAAANGLFFSDSACGRPLASAEGTWQVFVIFSTDRRLFALGEAYSGPAFISYTTGSCMEFPGAATRFFGFGDPLAAGAIAPVQMVPRGKGRLKLQMIESEGRSLAPVRHRDLSLPFASSGGPYFDAVLGVLCRPTWTVAGDVRCVPADSEFVPESSLTNFADSACTQPVVHGRRAMAVMLRSDTTLARQVIVEVRRVLEQPSTTAYTMVEGVCREYLKGAGYPLGEVVPLESFARLDVRTGAEPAP